MTSTPADVAPAAVAAATAPRRLRGTFTACGRNRPIEFECRDDTCVRTTLPASGAPGTITRIRAWYEARPTDHAVRILERRPQPTGGALASAPGVRWFTWTLKPLGPHCPLELYCGGSS